MSQQNASKLEFFVNLFNNLSHKKNVIILIGKSGVTISALKKLQVISSIFIDSSAEDFQRKYRRFLKKHKNYHITFLLDDKNCKLKHEIMPILGSIIKTNPVENFIEKNYTPEDIVAYNVYEITTQNGEVWNSCIASMPFIFPVNELLEYIIHNSFKYSGMYFLSLEFETIIERILQKSQNTEYNNHFQVFATITKSSDIRVVVKHNKNIMDEQVIEYPRHKSDMYIQGTIEQSISDKLHHYRAFIEKLNLKTCVITLSDRNLQKLLSTLKFNNSKTIAIAGEDICLTKEKRSSVFQDNTLIEIFNNFNTHLALNKPLKSITQLTLVNNIIFKPLLVIMLGICITLGAIKYKTVSLRDEISIYNQEYYSLSEEYREIQKLHPELRNASDILELHNLETLLNKTNSTPFYYLKNIFAYDNQNLKIKSLSWKISDPQNLTLLENKLKINIEYQYQGDRDSLITGVEIVNDYANRLRPIFASDKFTYTRNPEDLAIVSKKVIIPAKIAIETKLVREKDAR
jgi:hypothetical protein